jgi:hypothetical protein
MESPSNKDQSTINAPDEASSPEAPDGMPQQKAPEHTEDAISEGAGEAAGDPLALLAERAVKGRLSASEEEQAARLISTALLEGRDGVARVVEQLPRLPWVVGVNAVTSVWPEMKSTMRNRLLAGLARIESEGARRIRLSLARGIFKLEPVFAAKLAVGVAKEMRNKETGALAPRDAQVFANVLIGRAKPWIAQLPLGELKAAEADMLVQSALTAVFLVPHAPVTQLGVIKWAAESGKLAKLPKAVTEGITKGLNRWSGKWQGVLRREVEGLPQEIIEGLKADPPQEKDEQPSRRRERDREREEQSEAESGPEVSLPSEEREAGESQGNEDEVDAAPTRKERPVYESKTVAPRERERERERERRPTVNFNLVDALRQIEAHVASLRAELSAAQTKLRQRDDDRKPRRQERNPGPVIPGEPTAEELARLNIQLAARNAELQQRIEDLTVDSEERAASTGLVGGTPVEDGSSQLRNLLMLKLKEDLEDFHALESESPDIVAPKHYRTVLSHVVEVLAAEGIVPSTGGAKEPI